MNARNKTQSFLARLAIDELIKNQVDYFCIAPGSRSTPLVAAIYQNKKAKSFVHFDERGLAYHALGYASQTGNPVCLVCTSGTAAVNFFPAICEASLKEIPLIVLTADRPPELKETKSNQTIDQVHLYGNYTRWFFNQIPAEESIEPRRVLTMISQAVYRSIISPAGPVHINWMIRKPLHHLISTSEYRRLRSKHRLSVGKRPTVKYDLSKPSLPDQAWKVLAQDLKRTKYGLLIIGGLHDSEAEAVRTFLRRNHWPCVADITSSVGFGIRKPNFISHMDILLNSKKWQKVFQKIETVLHLGNELISKNLTDFLKSHKIKRYYKISTSPSRSDPNDLVTNHLNVDLNEFCDKMSAFFQKGLNKTSFQSVNKGIERYLKTESPGQFVSSSEVTYQLSAAIPNNSNLYVGNSLTVRQLGMFAKRSGNEICVYSNRGASGIDGIIASATGVGHASKKLTTCLLGDLSFLHDLNSLAMIRQISGQIIIVVLNNNGGRIFERLPNELPQKTLNKFFVTPQQVTSQYAAKMFNLDYHQITLGGKFRDIYLKQVKSKNSAIIEIMLDSDYDEKVEKNIVKSLTRVADKYY